MRHYDGARLEPCGRLPQAVSNLDQALLAELKSADAAGLLDAGQASSQAREAGEMHPQRLQPDQVPGSLVALVRRCGLGDVSETLYIQPGAVPRAAGPA